MQKKQFNITPTKIVQDIAPNKFPNDAAFSIRNMKINNQEDGAVLSLVTEKGNTMSLKINGIVLHIQDCIELGVLLFVKDLECTTNSKNPEKKDTLMLINKNEVGELSSKIIYQSDDLNFSEEAVIDSIYSYETENINKVYWVDGVHSTRVINLNRNYKVPNPEGEEEGNEEKFLNIRYLEFDISNLPESAIPNVTISAINNTYTMFTLGTIQYAISYFNKNLIESPIVYTSPIYYISNEGMALSKDGSQFSTTSFNLEIEVDALFDYIGLYRIHNIDSVYTVTRIREIEISSLPLMSDTNRRKATITDLGGTGVPISIDLFQLLGGQNIIGSTLEQKDSTLFIGNINIKKELVPLEIKDFLKNYANIYYANVATTNTSNDNINSITYYAKNLTKSNDQITYFKYCETYRFGLQLLDRGGNGQKLYLQGIKMNLSQQNWVTMSI